MRSPRLLGMVAIAAMTVSLAASRAPADGFDWRNVGGLDFTTPPKDQGSAGDCWDFSVVGPLEAKYKMTRNDASYSPDCSEMQLDWDGAWGGDGAFSYVCTHGVVSETECPYDPAKSSLGGTGPRPGDPWPLAPGWQNRVWISTGTIINTPQNTLSMKACIKMYGSCMMPVDCANDLYGSVSDLENNYHTALPSSSCDHDISVIGYQDDPKVPTGGYWIIKNSWGTGAGTNGYYYVPYGALETKGSGTPDGVPVQFIPGPVYYTGYMANATWKGGDGVWTLGGTNWINQAGSGAGNPNGPTYAWENKETGATFAGAGGDVAISGPVIAHGIVISSAGYSFSGGSLTVTAGGITANQSASIGSQVYVGAPQTWTVADGSALTINGPLHTIISDLTITGGGSSTIAGPIDGGGVLNIVGGAKPGGLIYTGSGALTLTGASNFAGDITLNGSGTLYIAPAGGANVTFSGALNGSGPIVITTTGTCSIGGSRSSFSGPISQSGGTLNFIPAAGVISCFNGVISGNCNVAQSGLGATVLYPSTPSDTNTYAGTTTISAGALMADIGTGIPSSSFLKLDGGVWQPVVAYTSFTRPLGTSGGTFQWTANGGGFAAGTGGDLYVNIGGDGRKLTWGTTIGVNIVGPLILGSQFGNHMTDFENPIDLGGDTRTVEADINPNANMGSQFSVLDGVISGSGGLRQTGAGRLDLNGKNTYSGDTTISGGVLHANVGQGIPAASFLRLDGGVLQSDAATSFTRTLGTSGGDSFQWTANGGGFSAASNGLTVNIGGGAAPATLAWGTAVGSQIVGPLMLNSQMSGGTLTFQNGIDLNGGARTITANGATGKDAYLTGVISDSAGGGSLVKNGAGALHLAGSTANTYAGVTTVADGTLYLENTAGYAVPGDLAINGQPDSSRVFPGAYVVINGNNQISPATNVSFNADSVNNGNYAPLATAGTSMSHLVLQGHAVTVASISDPLGMGVIENSDQAIPGGYNVSGGTLTVANSADCTFNGTICDTTNRSGTLSLIKNGPGRLTVNNYAASGPVVINGGTFDVASGTLSSPVSGSGSFAKTVFGDLTIAGSSANSYTGATTLGQGTLYLAKSSGYAVSGTNLVIDTSNCYLVVNGSNQINPAATLTFNYFRDYWSHLELWGNAVTLAGVSDATTWGELEDTQGDTGKGNGTLTINAAGNYSFNGEIRDTCGGDGRLSIVKTGPGTQVFTAGCANGVPNSYTGNTTISAGALQANDNVGLSAGSFLVLDGGVLQGDGMASFTRPIGISGRTFEWTANGGGFSAANGMMTVNIGGDRRTLNWGTVGAGIVGPLKFGSTTANSATIFQNNIDLGNGVRIIQVDDNPASTYDYAGITGAIVGTGGINKTGAGRLDLLGTNTYTALGTTVSGGLLNVPNLAALGTGYGGQPITIAANATLNTTSRLALAFTSSGGVLTNSGTLSGVTGTTLTLSGGAKAQGAGIYNCPVTLTGGGIFAPGGSRAIGTSSTLSSTWGDGGEYLFDIIDALGTAGTSWDCWNISGTLTAPTNGPFTIGLTSLRYGGRPGQSGLIGDFDDTRSYSWLIATATSVSGFNPSDFTVDASGFANPLGGGAFSVSSSATGVCLNFTPVTVPEPSTLALLATGLLGLLAFAQRWKKR